MDYPNLLPELLGDDDRQELLKLVDFLKTENRLLKQQMEHGGKKLKLTNEERRELATKGEALNRKVLKETITIVKPDTLLRWYRDLVRKKWDYSDRRNKTGRPPITKDVRELILRIARENREAGYQEIEDRLKLLGHDVCHQSVANILKANGLEPVPKRKGKTTWVEFLNRHKDVMWATDFFTYEVLNAFGLVTHHVLFFINHATRRVVLGGITTNPHGEWVEQIARNVTGWDGELEDASYLIHDRDPNYTNKFRSILRGVGIEPVRLPARSPNLNAFAERFVKSIKFDCLNHLILTTERQLRYAIKEYLAYYHHERPHQGLDGAIPFPDERSDKSRTGPIVKSSRLGGLLNFYYREEAVA